MATIQETIQVVAEFVDKNVAPQIKQLQEQVGQLKNKIMENNNAMQTGARKGKNLIMQFLGLMFFGMAVQRMFTGLIKPAMEAFGVFELWNLMLMVLFLPLMEMLFPLFLKFITFFLDLDLATKKVIGVIAILGVVLGTVMMIVGQMALGLNSLIALFGGTGLSLSWLSALFSGPFLLALGLVILMVASIVDAFNKDFMGIRDDVESLMENIGKIFSGLKDTVTGIFTTIKGLITGDTEETIKGLELLWTGFSTFIEGLFETLFIDLPVIISKGLLNALNNVLNVLADIINKVQNPFLQLLLFGPGLSSFANLKTTFRKPVLEKPDVLTVGPGTDKPFGLTDEELKSSKGGQSIVINQNTNIQVSDMQEWEKAADRRDKQNADNILRELGLST